MPTFVTLTRLASGSLRSPRSLEQLEQQVTARIRSECTEVEWLQSFALLGPHDYLNVFRAPDIEAASKVSALVRSFGVAQTELWRPSSGSD